MWLFPDCDSRPAALEENFALAAEDHGLVDVDAQGDAVAVWTSPGVGLFTDVEPFVAMLDRWSPQRRHQALEAMTATAHHHQPADMTLQIAAVRPERQGRGPGRRLLQRRLQSLDERATPAYLESSNSRNVALYERLGFASLGEVSLGGDGPVVRPMRRLPSVRSSPLPRSTD